MSVEERYSLELSNNKSFDLFDNVSLGV